MLSSLKITTRFNRFWNQSFQVRLTGFIILLTIPLLIVITNFITARARNLLETNAINNLRVTNLYLSNSVELWLDANIRALKELAVQPDILSMNPVLQKPVLEAMAANYPHMYLVSTTDTKGMNIARNDQGNLTDYSDRLWFQQARAGEPLTFQTLIGRTTGQPALVVSIPLLDRNSQVIGVAMFATDLDDLTAQIHAARVGESGISFLVDAGNQVIAHPNPNFTAHLLDFSPNPPVATLRSTEIDPEIASSGFTGAYTDKLGVPWRYASERLENGWIAVVQMTESELLAPARLFERISWLALGLILIVLTVLSWILIGRVVRPIRQLTESAAAISAGNFERKVTVKTSDELGTLARTFNQMSTQVSELVSDLEAKVQERTSLLEKRARQIRTTAELGKSISALENLDVLLTRTSRLIAEQFDYYHVGVFLIDENHEYAVLKASNSEGGQRMLARNHQLKIGQKGIVGFVAGSGKPRISLDVGQDAVYFDNPELPETRSELALPIISGNQILGVLDVQSVVPQAFVTEDVATLQLLADQIAVAITNARLYEENKEALETTSRLFNKESRESWNQLLASRTSSGYLASSQGTMQRVTGDWGENFSETALSDSISRTPDGLTIILPIKVRNQVIGAVRLSKPDDSPAWDQEETNLALSFTDQLSSALDSARLYADAQLRAAREALISDISMRISSTPQVASILEESTRQLGQAISGTTITFQLVNPDGTGTAGSINPEDVGLREIRRYVSDGFQTGFTYLPQGKMIQAAPILDTGILDALSSGEPAIRNETGNNENPSIAIPVKLRDQVIGLLHIKSELSSRDWKESEITLAQTIAERSAIAIENASLLSESQRRAARERTIGEISAKIGRLVDVDNILQTAVQELSRSVPGSDVSIQLQNK